MSASPASLSPDSRAAVSYTHLGAPPGQEDYSLTPDMYGRFLCELFDLWYEDLIKGQPVYIRQFYNYASILLTGRAEACDMNGYCSIQNVVEADGEVLSLIHI